LFVFSRTSYVAVVIITDDKAANYVPHLLQHRTSVFKVTLLYSVFGKCHDGGTVGSVLRSQAESRVGLGLNMSCVKVNRDIESGLRYT
jgi:hypothetical protein